MTEKMNKIEQLIDGMCPQGVEFRALGEVTSYSKSRVDASTLNEQTFSRP